MPIDSTLLRPVVSASWVYPFKGIYFCLTHKAWWPLFGKRLLPLMLMSLLVYASLFAVAYLPQVAFLAIFGHGPGAFVNAAVLVLGEGAVIIQLLFEAFLADGTMANVFDAVLIDGGCEELVKPLRELYPTATNPVLRLGGFLGSKTYSPFSFRQIIEFIVFLPLNFIPWVGTVLFLVITGARAGPLAHYRYFKMRKLSSKEKNKEIRSRRWKYVWFGTVQLTLQLVPGLAMGFLLTSAAGSALWVVQLERARKLLEGEHVVEGEATGIPDVLVGDDYDEDAPPPAYSDSV